MTIEIYLNQGVKMKGYLKVSEAAERLGVTSRTVIRLAHTGDLPGAMKKNPFAKTSPILIPEASIESFLEKRKEGIAVTRNSDGGNA